MMSKKLPEKLTVGDKDYFPEKVFVVFLFFWVVFLNPLVSKILGEGGFAFVYQAHDVAIKVRSGAESIGQ
jgi:hypothetical protein